MSRSIPLVMVLVLAHSVQGQEAKKAPDRQAIAKAIAAGKKFLIDKKIEVPETNPPQWNWEEGPAARGRPGGYTALALLALLHAGEKPDGQVIQRGLRYLRTIEPNDTYVVGLQIAVFARAGVAEDRPRIQRNVDWLIASRVMIDGKLEGWGYRSNTNISDNSNSQYALIGLAAGRQAGARIEAEVRTSIQRFYLSSQDLSGGWPYYRNHRVPTLTMTTAGLNGLLISGEASHMPKLDEKTGVTISCGGRKDTVAVGKASDWIGKNFAVDGIPAIYYNLYGLERVGRQAGLRYFGTHDWRHEGCDFLIANQRADGSWAAPGRQFDSWPIVSTSFALLFLTRADTPILLTKLVHGEEDKLGGDWDRQRHDLRNLADYAAREIYQQPELAWQAFNARQTRKMAEELLPDLLPCPLAFISGHQAPITSRDEEKLLQLYLEQGGTLLAEACCGSKEFDQAFRARMQRLYPDKLARLKADHPVWKAHAEVTPADFELWGIEQGGRTIVIYSPQPLSGYWDANRHSTGRGQQAFRLGGNIIRLAAGQEFPKGR